MLMIVTNLGQVPNMGNGRDGICKTWGQYHFETFDGIYYYFPGNCSYIFAKDCGNLEPRYTVWVHNSPKCLGSVYYCYRSISLFFSDQEEIQIYGHKIKKDGISLTLPQTIGQVSIEKLADYILVKTAFGFSLAWDGVSGIYLKISEEHKGKSCGLCGNYNGIQSDDFIIQQELMMMIPIVEQLLSTLEPVPMLATLFKTGEMIFQHALINVMIASSIGIVSAVAHPPAHLRNSVLGAISTVLMDVTVQMINIFIILFSVCVGGVWNCTEHDCPVQCSVVGDSHFTTFDGRHYSFIGMCQYILVKGTGKDKFTITLQKAHCEQNLGLVCLQSITLILEDDFNKQVTLSRGGQILTSPNQGFNLNVGYAAHCDVIHQELFAPCHFYISPGLYYQLCRHDACKCGSACLCNALAHYAYLCGQRGVPIDFRAHVSFCGVVCQKGMLYHHCSSFCLRSCISLSSPEQCNDDCAEGCNCPEGKYYEDTLNFCVPIQCSNGTVKCDEPATPSTVHACSAGKVYFDCGFPDPELPAGGVNCEITCTNLAMNFTCAPSSPCISGCVCAPGVCRRGMFNCTYYPCPAVCTIYGDRHYHSFDGLEYDYISDCQVFLIKSADDSDISIIAQNKKCFDNDIVCSKSVLISVGDTEIYLNDTPYKQKRSGFFLENKPTYQLWKAGYYMVIYFPEKDITLLWDKKTTIHIKVGPQWKNKLSGLCGNFDKCTSNDMTTSNNLEVRNAQVFGDSWALGLHLIVNITMKDLWIPGYSAFELYSKKGFFITLIDFSVKASKYDDSEEFKHLSSFGIEGPEMITPSDFTVFDMLTPTTGLDCENGNSFKKLVSPQNFCEKMWINYTNSWNYECDALSAYVALCNKFDICIQWRTPDYCSLSCPEGKDYQPCVRPCEARTCLNRWFYGHSSCLYLREDCVCKNGTILHRPHSTQCIPEKECACTDSEDQPRTAGEIWNGGIDECALYKCLENGSIIPIEPDCDEEPSPICEREAEVVLSIIDKWSCCSKEVCGCDMTLCETTIPTCTNSQKLTIGHSPLSCCPQYQCECDPLKCPSISTPECREDQFMIQVQQDEPCCFAPLCVCESCTEPIPLCTDGEFLTVDLNTTHFCCPQYYCECSCENLVMPTCEVGEFITVDHNFQSDCGCVQYLCEKDDVCVFQAVSVLNLGQSMIKYLEGDFCYTLECLEEKDNHTGFHTLNFTMVNCSKECDVEGNMWHYNCTTYECVKTDEGTMILNYSMVCPPFNESECKMINVASCDGKCPSATIYNINIESHLRFCKCCRENGVRNLTVPLYCSGNGTEIMYTLQEPIDCTCQWN
ncbi:hypothetical protein PAL_GLEAN10022422 [Pteropus alecto]|uniref:Otogelin-like protein n=1 Tax=Pteropus alecto TaxID=9402 RepID=L5JT02_PTEAL|nr:hypothetical protein PAL_GLEAN10022422 [Pteropus alecto]